MNKREAIQAMLDGNKVKQPTWKQDYLYIDDYGYVHNKEENFIDVNGQSDFDWEIYVEPPKPKFKTEEYVFSKRLSRFVRISNIKTNKLTISYSVYDGILYYEALEDDLKGEED